MSEHLELTEQDLQDIDQMVVFFGITPAQAEQRMVTGNVNGIFVEDAD